MRAEQKEPVRKLVKSTLTTAATLVISLAPTAAAAAAEGPMDKADERIQKFRTSEVELQLRMPDGSPLPEGTQVRVQMQEHAFSFGASVTAPFNVFRREVDADTVPELWKKQEAAFLEIFNTATVPFYWSGMDHEVEGKPTGEAVAERAVEWATRHGLRVKGHPLFWNSQMAPPLRSLEKEEAMRLAVERVDRLAGAWAGTVGVWDTVNEAATFDRPEMLQRVPGLGAAMLEDRAGVLRTVFQAARQADPDAVLLINDYIKDERYHKVIEELHVDGEPLFDAVGIQTHWGDGAPDSAEIWALCESFSRYGKPIHFTEISIMSKKREQREGDDTVDGQKQAHWPGEHDEAKQAAHVERFFTLVFSHPNTEALIWWNFSDRNAWKDAPRGLLHADMTPKQAFHTVRDLVKNRWWTNETAEAGRDGEVALRVFHGRHRVSATLPDGTEVAGELWVRRGEPTQREVTLQQAP